MFYKYCYFISFNESELDLYFSLMEKVGRPFSISKIAEGLASVAGSSDFVFDVSRNENGVPVVNVSILSNKENPEALRVALEFIYFINRSSISRRAVG